MGDNTTKTLVISDLHLGSPNCNTDGVLETLNNIEFDTLVINGDAYDDLNLHRLRKDHRKVLSRIWALSNEGVKVIWIKGNHDADILALFNNISHQYVISCKAGDICVLHGHQFDTFIRKYPLITKIVSAIYYYIRRVVKSNRFSEYVKYKSKSWLNVISKVRDSAIQYARQYKYRYIICGHTHHPEVYQQGEITYINCGSFMDTSEDYVLIESDENEATVRLVNGNRTKKQ